MRIAIIQSALSSENAVAEAILRAGMEPVQLYFDHPSSNVSTYQGFVVLDAEIQNPTWSERLKREIETGKPVLGVGSGAKFLLETGLVPGLVNYTIGITLKPTSLSEEWVNLRLFHDYQFNAFTRKMTAKHILRQPLRENVGAFVIPPGLLFEMRMQGLTVFEYCTASGETLPTDNIAAISNKMGNVMAMLSHPELGDGVDYLFQSMQEYIAEGTRKKFCHCIIIHDIYKDKAMFKTISLRDIDPALNEVIQNEQQRQEDHIELIASENYVSPAVLEAQGSVLTNKYAEGYPAKRYYGGCEFVDMAEQLAIERVKKLFGAAYANVQPHSGSQANVAAYSALIQAGDTVLGMSLSDGGHLTHGSPVNFSGKLYKFFSYGLDANGYIDYDQVELLANEHKPKLIVAGFSAYSRIVDWQRLRKIADKVGAYLMADMAHVAGLVATGLYPSPVNIADVTTSTTHKTLRGPRGGLILAKANPDLEKKLNSAVFPGAQGGPLMHVIAAKAVAFLEALQPNFKAYQQQVLNNARAMAKVMIERGFRVVSGGTDNHLFLIDLIDKGITGKDADAALGRAHITVNKNSVPNDPQSPFITSGLRLGTPAVTTRGFKEKECEALAYWICDILDDIHNEQMIAGVQEKVIDICRLFPVYSANISEKA